VSDEVKTLSALKEAQRLHPLTLLHQFVSTIPALVFIIYPVFLDADFDNVFSLFLSAVYGLAVLPAIVLRYLRFSYRLTPKQLVIQKGVFSRTNRSIPIERVQNVQIDRPLLSRFIGTARVKIETAGSSGTEASLEYVTTREAARIREAIRSFQRVTTGDGAAGDGTMGDDPAEGGGEADGGRAASARREELFAMAFGRVVLAGAFRFSLVYIAVIASLFQFVDPEMLVDWFEASRGELEGVWGRLAASPVAAGVATVLLAALLGWLTGIALTVNRYFGFRLWMEGDKLRRRQGLLNVTEGTIPLAKVQALIVRTNPLMRAFNWYTLQVQIVGTDVNEQGHRVVVPFAPWADVVRLGQRIRSFSMPEAFERVSPLTIRRSTVRATVAMAAFVVPGAYVWPADWVHLAGVALPWWTFAAWPLVPALAYLQYRQHGYALHDDGFYVRRGVFTHHLWILPTEKHHVFYTAASIFQRRLRLKTLFVDTAGAASSAYPTVVDVPAPAATTLADRLYRQFQTLYARRIEAATGSPDTRLARDERPALPDDPLADLRAG
jgi:putative membrane protein